HQPISALEHPSFKKVIEMAAQATNGVKIPRRKYTRMLIIDTFKERMLQLRAQLLVRIHTTRPL
ncbi:hypothetical protein OG21DRAFT_1421056, partial [Imleria badia]